MRIGRGPTIRPRLRLVLAALLTLGLLAGQAHAQTKKTQLSYASPDAAVTALVAAVQANVPLQLYAVLGPGSEKVVSSGDPYADAEGSKKFLAAYAEHHTLEPDGSGRMMLEIGTDDWEFPIPIVEADGRWHFDAAAGAQELLDRRIGRNEISAIRTLLACVDAEYAYFALTAKQGQGEFAERLVSRPGKQDGLYWPASSDEAESPLGPLVATAEAEGYPGNLVAGRPIPYQGYYFRVLKARGPNSPGGAKSFVKNGRMTGGFAFVTWPASYGASGIMTFIVGEDGVVFQKDLGPDTASIAGRMSVFDPDLSWARVELVGH
ncbi:MAG TPA: DUF2950 domain-containing protein [Acetobacteraceae bacterium]|nr:DUF2950 domain-containing protein [Acetobacteraceae bacterium]